jgi:pyrimidine operon attenuation protein / uracil phosphoribosyltransferase
MKRVIKKAADVKKLIEKLSFDMLAHIRSHEDVVLIGIRSRGVPLARRIALLLEKKLKKNIDIGELDINLYRDDVHEINSQPKVRETVIPFDLSNREVILVDDVLFSGRTIRSALNALTDYGRPKAVRLAVLIDRGNRELPIQPDFVGEKIFADASGKIKVLLKDIDGKDEIIIEDKRV